MSVIPFLKGLIFNLCIMLALVVLCALVRDLWPQYKRRFGVWPPGVLSGVMATVAMMLAVETQKGVIFDCRSGVIGACALIHGPAAAAVSIVPPLAYRLWLGGIGVGPGVLEIVLPAIFGSVCYVWFRRQGESLDLKRVLLSAVFISSGTMALTLGFILSFVPTLGLRTPGELLVVILNPALTIMVLGSLILLEEKHFDAVETMQENNRRALHSQKMAALGQFSRKIAHNFLNNFTVILGNAQIARDRSAGESEVKNGMDDIIHSVGRMSYLAGELLAFAHPSSLNTRRMDLGKSLSGIRKMLAEVINPEIELVMESSKNAGCVNIDPDQIAQAVVHMAVNAVEAMPGKGEIRIEARRAGLSSGKITRLQAGTHEKDRHKGEFAVLSVSDTGCGMPEEVCPRIFEPFFTTKEKKENTGLGLATVYNIIRSHDGYVDVESRQGRGTTFYIYFPVVEESETA
ncbi:MAG: ATP-binding protein [Kiritimatiellia bacterium]